MASYLCVKMNSSATKSYNIKSSANKPYLRVDTGFIPLTTATATGPKLMVRAGGVNYRLADFITTTTAITTGTSYLTSAKTTSTSYVTGSRASTSSTGYQTRASTSSTTYATRASTSSTTYATRASTSATTYATRASTSSTTYATRASTSYTSYLTTTSTQYNSGTYTCTFGVDEGYWRVMTYNNYFSYYGVQFNPININSLDNYTQSYTTSRIDMTFNSSGLDIITYHTYNTTGSYISGGTRTITFDMTRSNSIRSPHTSNSMYKYGRLYLGTSSFTSSSISRYKTITYTITSTVNKMDYASVSNFNNILSSFTFPFDYDMSLNIVASSTKQDIGCIFYSHNGVSSTVMTHYCCDNPLEIYRIYSITNGSNYIIRNDIRFLTAAYQWYNGDRTVYIRSASTYYVKTTATSYLTRSSTSGTGYKTRASTSKTGYNTRASTSATGYQTRVSTSATGYLTRSSTSNTTYATRSSQYTSNTSYLTQSETYQTSYITASTETTMEG